MIGSLFDGAFVDVVGVNESGEEVNDGKTVDCGASVTIGITVPGFVDAKAATAVAAWGPPPNVDRNTLINVIMKMAITDILLTRSASIISVRFLTLNLN